MINPVCFCETESYMLSDYPEISNALPKFYDLVTVTDENFEFKFTGVAIANNIPLVVFPKNFCIPDNEADILECAADLIRVLMIYKSEPIHEATEMELLYGESYYQNNQISTAIQLIDDFRHYGYINREIGILSPSHLGRIDWPATINKTIPFISHGKPAYFNTLMHHEKTDIKNAIYLIHRYIIFNCFITWGWMYGESARFPKEEPIRNVEDAIILLKRELRETYANREINTLKLMISYLQLISGTDKKRKADFLATRHYHFVWEAICGYMFFNQYNKLSSIIPQPVWETDGTPKRISQRPDIFSVSGSSLCIIDAKYYDIRNNLPGWSDVVKQLFYRHTLISTLNSRNTRKLLPNTNSVYNIFILPGSHSNPLEYIGRSLIKESPDLGIIMAFTIDQKKAMRTYAYRDDDLYRNHLVNLLVNRAINNEIYSNGQVH